MHIVDFASKQASKRYAWRDTVRVLAAVLVLVSHFAYNFDFERLRYIHNYFAGSIGRMGVSLFFAISGYLVANSLEKDNRLLSFYKTKLVRIVLPYTTSYFLVSVLFIGLSFFRADFLNLTPFTQALFVGGSYKEFFWDLLPIDVYLNSYFQLTSHWFIGEWFIGTLVWIYILSPGLYYMAKKMPIISFVILLTLSVFVYSISTDLIKHGFWLCIVRIPEFYLGMVFYLYKNKISNIINITMPIVLMIAGIVFWVDMYRYQDIIIADRFIPLKPRSFLFSFPFIISVFLLSIKLNGLYNLSILNKYSKISYSFMLIQHIVINTFMWNFDEQNFSKLGVLAFLLLIFIVSIYLARKITDLYKPIEIFLLKKGA